MWVKVADVVEIMAAIPLWKPQNLAEAIAVVDSNLKPCEIIIFYCKCEWGSVNRILFFFVFEEAKPSTTFREFNPFQNSKKVVAILF